MQDFLSTPPAAPAPLFTDDENNLFPSDQITSDPSFFDDFIPSNPSKSLPPTADLSLNDTPPTSPMGSPRSIWSLPKDADEPATSIRLSNSKEMEQKTHLTEPRARPTTTESLSQFKRRKLSPTTSATTAEIMGEMRNTPDTDIERVNMTSIDTKPQQTNDDALATQAPSNAAPQPEMQAGKSLQTTSASIDGSDDKLDKTESVEIPESSNAAADLPSPSSPLMHKPTETPRSAPSSKTTTSAADSTRRSRRSLPIPKLVQSPKQAREQSSRKRKKVSKETPPSRTGGSEFTINKPHSSQAYQVKHRTESQSEAGRKWLEARAQTTFHIEITKQARVRYTVGDIVSILFPRGEAGSARIVEVRAADDGRLSIVVQWLYSRSDAADTAGATPRLEQWPQELYMTSDHFQVICVENINGKSDATAVDDFYWAAGGRRIQPLAELEERLEKQTK